MRKNVKRNKKDVAIIIFAGAMVLILACTIMFLMFKNKDEPEGFEKETVTSEETDIEVEIPTKTGFDFTVQGDPDDAEEPIEEDDRSGLVFDGGGLD